MKKAFTLIELLVVMGIIGILTSILLPVIFKAREAANRSKCLSNLRQIGQATFIYADEHRGEVPGITSHAPHVVYNNYQDGEPKSDWRPFLLSVLKDKKAFYCPSQSFDSSSLRGWDGDDAAAGGLVVGYSLIGWYDPNVPIAAAEVFVDLPREAVSNRPKKITLRGGQGKSTVVAIAVDCQATYTWNSDYSQTIFTLPGDSLWADSEYSSFPHRRRDRTFDGSTAVYFDGHAEYKKREDLMSGTSIPFGARLNLGDAYGGGNGAEYFYF